MRPVGCCPLRSLGWAFLLVWVAWTGWTCGERLASPEPAQSAPGPLPDQPSFCLDSGCAPVATFGFDAMPGFSGASTGQ